MWDNKSIKIFEKVSIGVIKKIFVKDFNYEQTSFNNYAFVQYGAIYS